MGMGNRDKEGGRERERSGQGITTNMHNIASQSCTAIANSKEISPRIPVGLQERKSPKG